MEMILSKQLLLQFKDDLLSEVINSTIKSSIQNIKLWDPDTHVELSVTDIPEGITVNLVGSDSDRNKTYTVSFPMNLHI